MRTTTPAALYTTGSLAPDNSALSESVEKSAHRRRRRGAVGAEDPPSIGRVRSLQNFPSDSVDETVLLFIGKEIKPEIRCTAARLSRASPLLVVPRTPTQAKSEALFERGRCEHRCARGVGKKKLKRKKRAKRSDNNGESFVGAG